MLYASIDTLSFVLKDCSLKRIFEVLEFFPDNVRDLFIVDEFGCCKHIVNKGYKTAFKFTYNNMWFEGDLTNNDLALLDCNNYFDWNFEKIRVEFTGQALENLRRKQWFPDDKLQQRSFFESFGCPYSVTRVDFAFDFVNEKEENFYQIYDYVDNFYHADLKRDKLFTSRNTGISFERRTGSQNTLYLGKGGSSKILRIYDKLMERRGAVKNVKDIPYSFIGEDIKSWFRVELQLRRDYASGLLFASADGDLKNQFYFLFDNFMIYDKVKQGEYKVLKPFYDLYEWAKLQKLYKMQNPSQNEIDESYNIDKATRYITGVGAVSELQFYGHFGVVEHFITFERLLFDMQLSEEEYQINRLRSFNMKVSEDASRYGLSTAEWLRHFKVNNMGFWCFDYYKELKDFCNYVRLNNPDDFNKFSKEFCEDFILNKGGVFVDDN